MNACAQCAAADPQSLCSGCLVRYCSAACQRAHWVAHKPACVSAGAVIAAPLAAALAHCTCAVMPRSPWRPSREDERAGPEAYVAISARMDEIKTYTNLIKTMRAEASAGFWRARSRMRRALLVSRDRWVELALVKAEEFEALVAVVEEVEVVGEGVWGVGRGCVSGWVWSYTNLPVRPAGVRVCVAT
jgi:hypothetical protein